MIYKLDTKTQDTYKSTIIIENKIYIIDCENGIIKTSEIVLVNHLVNNMKFEVKECKETKEEKNKTLIATDTESETLENIEERINKIRGIKKLEKMKEEETDTRVKKIITKRIKELS